ncbi:sigma-54-dependent transcriptional regulator [Flavihumibacter petaseus]|uniref:Putative two-component response regulator n=1 Tax=Flavihumibacter petaseus NBRC 106054 TaxID=1220578 RepID=A0A0E9N5S4_9BACT|nr:sigma-54 dependent transcriptional regulator [Flavihumibacter petaseus]GAO44695.1 putative two-component response regulator [Flavihumibacter petaseus NBRC 106054]
MTSTKLLIVEDQFIEANNLQMILVRAGYTVCGIARSVTSALGLIEKETPDIVLLDIFLTGQQTGIDLARILQARKIAFVFLSANSNRETLEAAKATHPYGFLVKPFREKDVLVTLEIARYLHENSTASFLRNTAGLAKGKKEEPYPSVLEEIIGSSPKLLDLLADLRIVAPADTSVLILGESGTGKEKIAESIHALSARKLRPLIKVNCAALPASLIESTLFGHEKGAFTGATEKRIGKFEQASGGTLFLDEIGELPVDLQSKILRALQEKEIERVGGIKPIPVDIRIIAATNRNLLKEMSEGRFRMDLYYRLHVFPLTLPPLRERREDIPALVNYFVGLYSRKAGRNVPEVSAGVLSTLAAHDWPGNIRELEHTIERAVLLTRGNVIKDIYLSQHSRMQNDNAERVKTMEENERDHIVAVLKKCNGKVFGSGGAAELLGMNASTLNSRIRKLGIEKNRGIS